jgi:hypothetical protein
MHTDPIFAARLASLILEERRAEAAHAARLNAARAARPVTPAGTSARRMLGAALVRLGTRLGGVSPARPATHPA